MQIITQRDGDWWLFYVWDSWEAVVKLDKKMSKLQSLPRKT